MKTCTEIFMEALATNKFYKDTKMAECLMAQTWIAESINLYDPR